MAWTKAWPTLVKEGLIKEGFTAGEVKTLEAYGSLTKALQSKEAAKDEVRRAKFEMIMKKAGIK